MRYLPMQLVFLLFFCFFHKNNSSQTRNYKGKRDLSPYFALGVEKCHPIKNKPSESISQDKIFTFLSGFACERRQEWG